MGRTLLVIPTPNMEQLKNALQAGGDAYYLPVTGRVTIRFATDFFSPESLPAAIELIHSYQRLAYVVINGYPTTADFDEYITLIKGALDAGCDGLVLANIALIAATRKLTDRKIIASGVVGAASPDDAKFLASLGADRVIIPRLLFLEEMINYLQESPIESEAYMSGFVCPAYDGKRCRLQNAAGQHSAPEGACITDPNTIAQKTAADGTLYYSDGGRFTRRAQPGRDLVRGAAGLPQCPEHAVLFPCTNEYQLQVDKQYVSYTPWQLTNQCDLVSLPYLLRAGVASLKVIPEGKTPQYTQVAIKVWQEAISDWYRDPVGWYIKSEWIINLQNAKYLPLDLACYIKGPCF